LENWAKTLEDEVTSSLFFFYMLKRNRSWISVRDLGERAKFSFAYENANADAYHKYDTVDVSPIDGISAGFYNWRQIASSISISRIEERQNSGEYQWIGLLDEKTQQAKNALIELFDKASLQGNGINTATAITTAYTSPNNGSVFYDPMPLLIGNAPTSGTVGSIPCNSVNSKGFQYWANQKTGSTAANYAAFLTELEHLRNMCARGIGGFPNIHLTDQATYELYMAALRSQNRFTDYTRADIPFDNVAFHGQPVTWDEYMPNWAGGTTVQAASQGTWLMINSNFYAVKYDAETNFITTPFVRPENQDAKSALVLWYGTGGVSQRRKHGVLSGINTAFSS